MNDIIPWIIGSPLILLFILCAGVILLPLFAKEARGALFRIAMFMIVAYFIYDLLIGY